MATIVAGPLGLNIFNVDITALQGAKVVSHSSSLLKFDLGDGQLVSVTGTGFTYSSSGVFAGGTITGLSAADHGQSIYTATGLSVSAPDFSGWISNGNTMDILEDVLSGNDTLTASNAAGNVLFGFNGDNSIVGGASNDMLWGGGGSNTILGAGGDDEIGVTSISSQTSNFLRGGEGDDRIYGGLGDDNVNGNQGDDTIEGSEGTDWLLGGQGDDHIGTSGYRSIINGNLGNDTIAGFTSDSCTLRGGQGDDVIRAGFGGSDIYGDRGDDTITGEYHNDTIHFGPGGGHDRIISFDISVDRIQLEGASSYTITVVGNDTVIDIGDGDTVTLANIVYTNPNPHPAWIVLA